jgi:hypothetical protein
MQQRNNVEVERKKNERMQEDINMFFFIRRSDKIV